MFQFFRFRQARQMHEDFTDLIGNLGMCRQDAEIGIDLGRGRMVIACAKVGVIPECAVFAADDQCQLGVCFQSHYAINHLCTSLF